MRGERATLGKSLLDVQRELRIKASYIVAIEDANPSAFDTPGFIPGYVRSYARFLKMDPDAAFVAFCAESGFVASHGMSAQAAVRRPKFEESTEPSTPSYNPFVNPKIPFIPSPEGWLFHFHYNAVGSIAVLLVLIGAIGFGGLSILREVQRVQIGPIEQVPLVLSELDPLQTQNLLVPAEIAALDNMAVAQAAKLDRMYRPKALDAPVLVERDGPISALDPNTMGLFVELSPEPIAIEPVAAMDVVPVEIPKVVGAPLPELILFAIRPAWVRIRSVDGDVIFEKILDAGEEYKLPQTEGAPLLRAGMSGSLYFKIDEKIFGPVGQKTSTIKNVALSVEAVTKRYAEADIDIDPVLARIMALAKIQSKMAIED
ncbi:MAG: DUF4115 domain-containing protein [Paracoccaceae bacterium]|nr:DUF4115 domain-containing protein [Paracoccaceae bacterium]